MFLAAFVAVAVLFGCSTTAQAKSKPAESKVKPIVLEIEEVDEATVPALMEQLDLAKKAGHKDIWIKLDTYGGSVHWGNELKQFIENFGQPITCVVDTKAMSMGFLILQSCDTRLMTKRSELMVHEPWTRVAGGAAELTQTAEHLKVMGRALLEDAAERMGMPVEEMAAKCANGAEWYIGWEEAVKINAVDRIINKNDIPPSTKVKGKTFLELLLGRN